MNTTKSNEHRRVHRGGGYQANSRGLYPTWKARYKKSSNHRCGRIVDHLAEEELGAIETEAWQAWRDALYNHRAWDEEQEAIEAKRYAAWCVGTEYPNEDPWLDFQDSYQADFRDSLGYYDEGNNDYLRNQTVIESIGNFTVDEYTPGIYYVRNQWDTIGAIHRVDDAMRWDVCFMSRFGNEPLNVSFDYLETSITAAATMLIVLHRTESRAIEERFE